MHVFKHKETGVHFEYESCGDCESILAPPPHGGKNVVYRHKVFVSDFHGQGWRHALVLGHVAYVVTDEREADGNTWWITEKWPIQK